MGTVEINGRSVEEINEAMTFFWQKAGESFKVIIVQDNYSHSLQRVMETLDYCRSLDIAVPDHDSIEVLTLAGPRYKRIMSIEFYTTTQPPKGIELTVNSGLWDWLVY